MFGFRALKKATGSDSNKNNTDTLRAGSDEFGETLKQARELRRLVDIANQYSPLKKK